VIRLNAETTFTSLTAHRQSDYRAFIDIELTELALQALELVDLQHQISQELTLGRRTPKLSLIGGAFLFDEDVEGAVVIILRAAGTERRPHATIETHAWALFGQATYQMSRRVSITGRLRYSDEAKNLANNGGHVPARHYASRRSPAVVRVDRAAYKASMPKVSIEMRATPAIFVYASASPVSKVAISQGPQFWIGYQMSGQAHEQLGHDELALQALASAAQLSRQNSKPVSLTGYILGRAGRTAEARDVLNTLTTTADRYVPPYALALVNAGLGDQDALFVSLERAYRERDVHLMFLSVDPKWDPYREDPRFVALLAECGFTATER
jgi:hypothetical protein